MLERDWVETIPSDAEIVEAANELARMFYAMQGYVVKDGYRFDKAHHPHEQLCWEQACMAYEYIEGTDVKNALLEMEDNE